MSVEDLIKNDIVKVKVDYNDFDNNLKSGYIEVHKSVADEVVNIFSEIKDSGFIIDKIKTIDNYDYSDKKSVIDNNTSGYNFRFIAGTRKLSDHSIGLAIDINPAQNPWVHKSALNLFKYDPKVKGTIIKDTEIINIFKKYGWEWGGDWKTPDYQHFYKAEKVKDIKNDLYDRSGIKNPYKSKIDSFKDYFRKILND